ncbi:MAG: AAA family ATPase [Agarilytica sp.]
MYHNYFGLKEQAFSIAVNPRYLYMSHQHKEALAHLLYGVKEGGFVMLSGEVGTGKTTIIRCLLEQLPANTEIAIILNPMSNIKELLCTICDEFGIIYNKEDPSVKTLTDLLQQHLLDNHKKSKNTILLIDEAQLLSAEVLEQIRLLTNLETSTKKLLQIVLVGQPELNELLAQPRLRQLSQRITARFHLTPLTLEETERYISHRLSVAGMPKDKNPFTPRIVKQIHRFTGGIPRMINVLCERTLIGAYGHNKSQIDNKIFDLARKEVEGHQQSQINAPSNEPPYVLYGILSASAIVGLVIIYFMTQLIFGHAAPTPYSEDIPYANSGRSSEPRNAQAVAAKGSTKSTFPNHNFDIPDKIKAQARLFEYLDFDINSDTHPCWQINTQGHHCGKAQFDTWDDISALNRPVVLTLINQNKFNSYAVLAGIQDKHALLIDGERNRKIVSLEELGPLWTGEIFYSWKKPKDFTAPISYGDKGKTVSEVANQFALLDAQTTPLTKNRFNSALRDRVKLFQRENKLKDDGILGERTLMKLNDNLGLSTTLEREFL